MAQLTVTERKKAVNVSDLIYAKQYIKNKVAMDGGAVDEKSDAIIAEINDIASLKIAELDEAIAELKDCRPKLEMVFEQPESDYTINAGDGDFFFKGEQAFTGSTDPYAIAHQYSIFDNSVRYSVTVLNRLYYYDRYLRITPQTSEDIVEDAKMELTSYKLYDCDWDEDIQEYVLTEWSEQPKNWWFEPFLQPKYGGISTRGYLRFYYEETYQAYKQCGHSGGKMVNSEKQCDNDRDTILQAHYNITVSLKTGLIYTNVLTVSMSFKSSQFDISKTGE